MGDPPGTKASTSAIETSTRRAPSGPAGITERASSMSVVLAASMVTVGTSRRSRRSPVSGAAALARAASSTAAGKTLRIPWRTTQRSRPRSAPAGTARRGTTSPPRMAATTKAPPSRPSAAPSTNGQSVLATTRSTLRKRRRPRVVAEPKSSTRWRSTSARALAEARPPSATVTTALARSPSRKGLRSGGVTNAAHSPSGPSRLRKPKPRGWMEMRPVRRAGLSFMTPAPYPKALPPVVPRARFAAGAKGDAPGPPRPRPSSSSRQP